MQANFDNYCEACYKDLPHRHLSGQASCQICAVHLAQGAVCGDCLNNPPAFDKIESAFHYLPPITGMVHAFKDEDQQGCGRLLTACLVRHLQQYDLLDDLPQALIPMPLHFLRQRQRGFNQAQVIAQQLGKALAIPVWDKHCVKIKNTASQQGQQRAQRVSNLAKAFQVKRPLINVKHIAIVDDVVTTGSTANALATAIRQAGEQNMIISIWSLARTLPPHSQLHLTHFG